MCAISTHECEIPNEIFFNCNGGNTHYFTNFPLFVKKVAVNKNRPRGRLFELSSEFGGFGSIVSRGKLSARVSRGGWNRSGVPALWGGIGEDWWHATSSSVFKAHWNWWLSHTLTNSQKQNPPACSVRGQACNTIRKSFNRYRDESHQHIYSRV